MAKRLRVEQAKREYTTNSLWWLNNVQEMFFLILSHLPIKDIVKCRLVCHAWSSWALHDLVWSRHVDRISTFYPFFKSEFVDVLPKQTVGPGRLVEYDVPAKRRKAGGKRKVSPKKNETLSHSGNWYAVRAFLNNKLAIAKAQTIHALDDHFVGLKKDVKKRWYGKERYHGWRFEVSLENLDECFLFMTIGLNARKTYHVQEYRIAIVIDGIFHFVKV